MTPDPHLALAERLAAIAAEIAGLSGPMLDHFVQRHTASWQRRLPDVLAGARTVLGDELLRKAPVYGLDGERPERFAHDA